jgi:hypothetical protein
MKENASMATSPVRPAAYIRTAVGREPGHDRAEMIDSAPVESEVERIDARLNAEHRAREAGCRVRRIGSHGGQLLALVIAIAKDRYDAVLIASFDRVSRRTPRTPSHQRNNRCQTPGQPVRPPRENGRPLASNAE